MTVAAGMVRRHLILALVLVGLVALPVFATDYFTSFVVTRALMLGMAAATIVFLHAYGGMTSLAQYLLFGIAGFMVGNASGQAGSRGLQLGWDPWVAVVFALAVCLAVSWVLGALASNSTGIYYLMLTLVYAVIGFSFFGQVTTFSGFGGITGITPPALIADQPFRLYYLALLLSLATYLGLRALARTPFGLALQGIRDDHVRMASLAIWSRNSFNLTGASERAAPPAAQSHNRLIMRSPDGESVKDEKSRNGAARMRRAHLASASC
jgi:branched-chain amino acid transport system permease protein